MWHYHFGHPTHRTVQRIISRFSLPIVKNKADAICGACQQAKRQQLPFHDSTFHSNAPLDLIFSDVWGPSPICSINGRRYYVSFVDHFSKFTWLFPIKLKSDVMNVFKVF